MYDSAVHIDTFNASAGVLLHSCRRHMVAFAAHCLTRFLYSLMSLASSRAASWLAGDAVLGSVSSDWMDDNRLLTVYTGLHLSAVISRQTLPSGNTVADTSHSTRRQACQKCVIASE